MARLVDGSTARREVSHIDCLSVYVKELIAGGAAGAFAKTTIAPLVRIKILLQTRTDGFQSLGVYQSLKKVLKHEGVLGFYKLTDYFTIFLYLCSPIEVRLKHSCISSYGRFLLGYIGLLKEMKVVDTRTNFGCGARSLYPQPAYSGITDVLTTVYKEAGIRGLYRGLCPTLTGILPYAGLKFYIYEVLKTHVPEENQKSIVMHLSSGALAGLLGQTFTYPLDVVRRQMQVESLQPSTIQGDTVYRNTWEGLATIVRNQGWTQLFAGLSINYI
ncbi:mitochondrial carrier protein CoAc1-like [Durio zibethinus]|uniref:Mitochondrial carrier protein CoAc1-like n=1 Tax=Durio zibethinus TaxID=66656 RepID=A0A6P5ZNL7_DURZI|nr:mitochondrial carrier protein CoAc1-like [Durio zibethinus]